MFLVFFFRFQLNSPMNLLKASRPVWRERTPVLARTSWTYPTCLSGSPCCMVWPSCTQWCKREGSLDHWDGIFHTSSTPPISTPVYSLYRTIWMTWTSKRWERLICLFSLIDTFYFQSILLFGGNCYDFRKKDIVIREINDIVGNGDHLKISNTLYLLIIFFPWHDIWKWSQI